EDVRVKGTTRVETAFEEDLSRLALEVAVRASTLRERGAEWVAIGLALAVLYVLFVVSPRGRLTMFDVVVLTLVVACATVMGAFEYRCRSDLLELSVELRKAANDGDSEVQQNNPCAE
ncbi:MAG TPA: hypothetical protein VFU13_23520, partial [Steroidobacteraceae bacterium]|nr:hypothetical protein [Steroidobacteraceae bacterium]